jgi:hypothetical protein
MVSICMRPPIAQERLHLTPDGQVILDLRHRWADGTTYLVFEPLELLERLASLTPRPRINLLLYYGVLGARSAWRARIGASNGRRPETLPEVPRDQAPADTAAVRPKTNWLWAELMQRSFGFDVLMCPRCGDRLELMVAREAGCGDSNEVMASGRSTWGSFPPRLA